MTTQTATNANRKLRKPFRILYATLGIIMMLVAIYIIIAGASNYFPFHTDPMNLTDYEYKYTVNPNVPNLLSGGFNWQYEDVITTKPLENPAQYNLKFIKSFIDTSNRTPYFMPIIISFLVLSIGGVILTAYGFMGEFKSPE